MLSCWDWNARREYSENVCFVGIDEGWWNDQTSGTPINCWRRQLSAAELFPVPGKDDISPAKMGVGGLVPVVAKDPTPTAPEPESASESAPTSRRRLHDASKCREVRHASRHCI